MTKRFLFLTILVSSLTAVAQLHAAEVRPFRTQARVSRVARAHRAKVPHWRDVGDLFERRLVPVAACVRLVAESANWATARTLYSPSLVTVSGKAFLNVAPGAIVPTATGSSFRSNASWSGVEPSSAGSG